MASEGGTTTDHKIIKKWIEDRGGHPSVVRATEDNGKSGGLLRVEFRDPEDALDEVDWDEFFKVFDDNNLAFVHQDKTKDGKESRFNRFVSRDNA
jgi:hypothetical protein